MLFDVRVADELFKAKIFLAPNCASPTQSKYGWMALPANLDFTVPVTIEERSGLYGGHYRASIGAAGSHGLCSIGAFSYSYSPLPAGLQVGRYCSISSGLVFLDSHHQTHLLTTSAITFRPENGLWRDILESAGKPQDTSWHIYNHKPFPVIGNDVWIGRDVTLAMGITIGDGAVIAANSLVTKDVAPYTIVGGNPAKVLRERFSSEVASALLRSKWWELHPGFVASVASLAAEEALARIDSAGQDPAPFEPTILTLSNEGLNVRRPRIAAAA